MDYERIESLFKKLHTARIDVRIRTASNLLFKLESGIFDKDTISHSTCMSTLMDGINKSLEFILQNSADLADHSKEAYELLGLLLSLIKSTAADPSRNIAIDSATKVLDQLYQLKNVESVKGKLQMTLEETIDAMCGLNQTPTSRYAAQVHMEQRALELALTSTVSEDAAREAVARTHTSQFHGAGAILNSRLAYTGWKFPHFVLTERDERWLFDVDVRVKLQHECAARELWAVLADLPAQALLLKTNLLHSVLDLVGAPYSQADIEADPLGLHPLTALRWLDGLLNKCRHAFRVQMDGSLCSCTPHHAEFSLYHNTQRGAGDDYGADAPPDLAGKLAQAMYALRHPLLPPPPPHTEDEDRISAYQEALHNKQQTPLGALSALFPTPSYPGLAFSCCAASLKLLQTRDTTVGRSVLALLRTALPCLLEPRLQGSNGGRLLDVERDRLQHLLNRVEQLLAFFGESFDLDAFLALMYSDDEASSGSDDEGGEGGHTLQAAPQHHQQQHQQRQQLQQARREQADATLGALRTSSFDLTFLTAVVEVLKAVPVWAMRGQSSTGGATTTGASGVGASVGAEASGVTVGALTQACICRLVASQSSIEALLPGCATVAQDCLAVLDGATLRRIQATSRTLACAHIFTARNLPDEELQVLLPKLVSCLEDCVCLLDAGCPVSLPSAQSALVVTLPVLLLAAHQYPPEEQGDDDDLVARVLALICRVLSCGDDSFKTTLLEHLLTWTTKAFETLKSLVSPGGAAARFAEAQSRFIRQCDFHPATGRQVVPLLATPQVLQCLLSAYLTSAASDSALNVAVVDLLDVLCAYLVNNETITTSGSGGAVTSGWAGLLLPLKVLEWEIEPVDGAQCAVIAFARKLQDACADSTDQAERTAFARSLVLGLFHSTSAVRINSALRARRDLLGVPLPAGLVEENAEQRFGVLSYDLFPAAGGGAGGSGGAGLLRLGEWTAALMAEAACGVEAVTGASMGKKSSKTVTAKLPSTNSFTHADVRKIASIGLGELEPSIKASALGQLLDMLDSDSHLLHTADANWCGTTLRAALQQLSALAPFSSSSAVTCDAEHLQAMSDAQCRLFTETARVVCFFFTHFAFLRQYAYYFSTTTTTTTATVAPSPSVQPVAVLLRVLLGAHQLKKANSSAFDAMQQVAATSAQVLCLLSTSTEAWVLPLPPAPAPGQSSSSSAVVAVSQQYVLDSAASGIASAELRATSLCVPVHVARRFRFPVSVLSANEYTKTGFVTTTTTAAAAGGKATVAAAGGSANHSSRNSVLGHIVLVSLHCAPSVPAQYPMDDIVRLLVAETSVHSADRIHVATATKLFGLISAARNHSHLRESLSSALCLFQANPSLLHVFLCLRMSLVTALSSIVTVNPRTHKDHITLCAALDFLQQILHSLRATSTGTARHTISASLHSDIIEACNEALSAVLPSMAAYFAEHFGQANTFFVNLTSSTGTNGAHTTSSGCRESDKEHAAASHSVCSSYFRLLHTLSAFADPRLQLGAMLTGHYVTGLLVHIAGSEMHNAHDRSVALGILENLLRHHSGGWEALCCVENPENAFLGGNYQKPTKIAQLKARTATTTTTTKRTSSSSGDGSSVFDLVDCLARIVRLVRTPDSMQGTSSVVGALRLLYLALLQRRDDGSLPSLSVQQSQGQWKWLVRLLYDRRSEVKVLAVEVLGVVMRQIVTTAAASGASDDVLSVDSLAQTAPAVHSTSPAATPATAEEENLLHWPPFELLGHLVTDSTESTALRTRATDILVHAYTEQPNLRPLMRSSFKLSSVVNALFEFLSVKDCDYASSGSIRSALSTLTKLLSTRDDTLLQEVLSLTRSMKLVPQVVELLNARIQGSLNVRALARVSVFDDNYLSRERTTYFHGDALSLRAAAASTLQLQGAGWATLQNEVRCAEVDGMRNGRAAACWLFFHLKAADPALFDECVDHSNLVYHLTTCFSAVAEPISPSSVFGFEFECASVSAQAELLSLLISQEAAAVDQAKTQDAAPIGALYAYVQANPVVPSNVLKKMILVLLNIMDFAMPSSTTTSSATPSARTQQQLHCVSSCLRLLSLMLNEAHWRDRLGLGGPQANTSMSNLCAYMFDLLLSLRKLLCTLSASAATSMPTTGGVTLITALISRVDVSVALFMQYSYEARVLFVQHSVQHQLAAAEASRASTTMSDKCIFQQHIDTITSAVLFLNTPPAAATTTQQHTQQTPQASHHLSASVASFSASTTTPTFSASGPLTPEAKRSLQGIKAKSTAVTPSSARKTVGAAGGAGTPASVAASPSAAAGGGAGRHPVNHSMSSWATKTSQSSKWRDRSRSYAWNKDKAEGSGRQSSGPREMPDQMKLQLWAALTVLAAAFPNCDPAVDWAIELKLHHSLSRLLRFAAKHSVATLISSQQQHSQYPSAVAAALFEDPSHLLWAPSNGMLACAISSLCCAFTYQNTHAKQCFASTGDAAAAVLGAGPGGVGGSAGAGAGRLSNTNKALSAASAQLQQPVGGGSSGGGTALHQLISVGISRSFVPVTRWLCLSMAGSLLSGARTLGSPTLKSTFSQIVALSLQRSLHAAHSDPEAVVPLLNTLCSFLSGEEDLAHLTQLCKKDQSATLRNFQLAQGLVKENTSAVEDFKLITFPELIKWVWSSACARSDVAAAVCRCLGRISIVDRAHRTVGNLLSEEMISVLCECYNSTSSHPVVNSVSALALWHIVHHSEKAKVMVREQMLRSPNSVAFDYGGNGTVENGRNITNSNSCSSSPTKSGSRAARELFGAEYPQHPQYLQGITEEEGEDCSSGDGDGGWAEDAEAHSAAVAVLRAKSFINSLRAV